MNPLDKVIDKAARAFLGVHKFCPIVAMYKDLDWKTGECRRKLNVLRYWNRLISMPETRLTKMLFNDMYDNVYRGSWCYYVKNIFRQLDMIDIYKDKQLCNLQLCESKLESTDKQTLLDSISKKPKLRLFKEVMCEDGAERYVKLNLTSGERSMIAQIRMGILPIRVETGRYTNMKMNDRLCQICNTANVEDEIHFIMDCSLYDDLRHEIFTYMNSFIDGFGSSDRLQQFYYIMQCNNYTTINTIFKMFSRRILFY